MKRFFYLYQITNLINNKIYIGVHGTDNLDDGYMGSGKVLKVAQRKYGLKNFKKDILKYFESEEEMYLEEAELVSTEFVNREDTYNISEGGKYVGKSILQENGRQSAAKSYRNGTGLWSDEAKAKKRAWNKEWHQSPEAAIARRKGHQNALSEEANEKRKATLQQKKHQQGSTNSQFGSMWITNGTENKKIQKGDEIPDGWRSGRILKKRT